MMNMEYRHYLQTVEAIKGEAQRVKVRAQEVETKRKVNKKFNQVFKRKR